MKQITITIQVPDGVNVNVSGGQSTRSNGGGGGGGGSFTPRPEPDYPNVTCVECGENNWRLIKAGFSKTKKNPDGSPKRFNAFYVCDTDDCDGKPQDALDAAGADQTGGDDLPF